MTYNGLERLACLFLFLFAIGWSPTARTEPESVPEVEESEEVEGDIADPYDLFDPVPRSLMRPMVTDRPTFVDSPRTLDAGHFQLETALVDYEKDVSGSGTTETILFNQINLKFGLNLDADAQVIVQSYKIINGGTGNRSGFGDVTLRFKFNVFGNDRGSFAGALIPFLKIPTNSSVGNRMFEGGLYLPLEWVPAENWSVTIMVGPEFLKNSADNNFHFELIGGAAVSTVIARDYIPFVEYLSRYNAAQRVYSASAGGGLAYMLGSDWQVDAGATFGLNANSADLRFFTGLSLRL